MGHGRRGRRRLRPPRRVPLADPELRPHVHRRHLDPLVLRHPPQERRPRCRQRPAFLRRRHPGRQDLCVQQELGCGNAGEGGGQGVGGGFEGDGGEGGEEVVVEDAEDD